jgi:hypothetical protein
MIENEPLEALTAFRAHATQAETVVVRGTGLVVTTLAAVVASTVNVSFALVLNIISAGSGH